MQIKPPAREAGHTYQELLVSIAVLLVVLVTIGSVTLQMQRSFAAEQLFSQLVISGEHSMERIVATASQAVTTDTEFSPIRPNTGTNSHGFQFRLLESLVGGNPVYDDTLRVYIYGPDPGSDPCSGIIIGRGPDLASVHAAGSGPDNLLGTADDDTTASIASGVPAVELLMHSRFAPRAGEMFTVNVDPAPLGRFLTFTMRLNATGDDGNFLLESDLVLTERVALRQ